MTRLTRHSLRLLTVATVLALGAVIAPATQFAHAPAAQAAGDVCDICSVNFDLGACEDLGGWPYDSTLESPPPAITGASAPAPAAPAPAPAAPAPAPAAPAPAAPAKSGTGAGTSGAATTAETSTEVVAVAITAPLAPTELAHKVSGRSVTLTWVAPADGGSPITGYKLVLNEGTPIAIAADKTSFTLPLGAGTYEAALIATNAVGDSEPVALAAEIEVTAASATPTPDADDAAEASAASSDSGGTSPLLGVGVLGALVVAGGGLLGWWAIRRRKTTGGVSSPTPQ